MTGWQELSSRLEKARARGSDESPDASGGDESEQKDPWESAPAPAQVAKRLIEGVFQREVGPERIPLLTNAAHWAYGTTWGGVYGLLQGTVRANPIVHGLFFGSGVWAMSYVQLVPMGLYQPPWKYPLKSLGKDLSYHLVYGLGVAAAYERLDGGERD